jgi:hypothetical protein
MMRMITARTSEVDDIEAAVEELSEQINLSSLNTEHCGGMFFCHKDLVDSGVAAAVCKAMPFPVIGMTSMATADEHGYSQYDLCLTVLEDDSLTFFAGMTNSIEKDNYASEIGNLFSSMRSQSGVDPALIFTFVPYLNDVSGADLVSSMDDACHGIPMWGSITNTIDFNYREVSTICGDRVLRQGLAMLFVCGDIKPKFVVCSLPDKHIHSIRATITKSDGCIIKEVNEKPLMDYLADIGLYVSQENINTCPLMIYYDGEENPVALGMFTVYDDGSAMSGGLMPVGTRISVGSITSDTIVQSAEEGLEAIKSYTDRRATLLLPCVTRFIMLSPDNESELNMICSELNADEKPFMMGYSGGEICPMRGSDGKLRNRFHNYTFCACIL